MVSENQAMEQGRLLEWEPWNGWQWNKVICRNGNHGTDDKETRSSDGMEWMVSENQAMEQINTGMDTMIWMDKWN